MRATMVSLICAAVTASGCAAAERPEPTSAEIVAAAREFGGIVLPADAELLKGRIEQGGPDTAVRLAIKTTPAGAEQLVTASGLELNRDQASDHYLDADSLAGPPIVDGPWVQAWQGPYRRTDGSKIYRNIAIDSKHSPAIYVHLTLFEI